MVGMECLQLRTINLQAFKRTKPCAEEPVGCLRRLRAFSPRGKELGAGRDSRDCLSGEEASGSYQVLGFGFFHYCSNLTSLPTFSSTRHPHRSRST